MTARQKIEALTNRWYGFYLFSAVAAVFSRGIGPFSLLRTIVSLGLSILFAFFLGRRLLAKSSFWRFMLLVVSGLGSITGVLGVGKTAIAFLNDWSFSLIAQGIFLAIAAWMNVKSFSTLRDPSVRAYFN